MSYCGNFWHIDAHDNPITCLFDSLRKMKTEYQLIRFAIAYLVADNNAKRETLAACNARLHNSRPMASKQS